MWCCERGLERRACDANARQCLERVELVLYMTYVREDEGGYTGGYMTYVREDEWPSGSAPEGQVLA